MDRKKCFYICAFCFFMLIGLTTMAQTTFERIFETTDTNPIGAGAAEDSQGNFIMAYEADDVFYLLKADSLGNFLWAKKIDYGMNSGFYGQSIVASANRYFFGGFVMGNGTGSRDGNLIITDYDGNPQTLSKIDDSGHSNAIHSARVIDEGFILAGRTDGGNGGSYDAYLMKLMPSGVIEWVQSYGGTGWDWGRWAEPTSDGGYIMTGYADGFTGNLDDAYIVKTDNNGVKQWSLAIESGTADVGDYVREDSNHNYYIGGYTLGMNSSNINNKGFVTKLSNSGSHIWTTAINDIWDIYGMVCTEDNGVVLVGDCFNHQAGSGSYDILLLKLDSMGNEVFCRIFGGPGIDYPNSLEKTADGGYLISGVSGSFGTLGAKHIYLIKTDANGNSNCNDKIANASLNSATPTIYTPNDTTKSSFQQENFTPVIVSYTTMQVDPCCTEQVYADFYFIPEMPDTVYTFLFTNFSIGNGTYFWDFGDGNSSTFSDPTHTYADTGTFSVCLTMAGICDTSTICHDVQVVYQDTSTIGVYSIERGYFTMYPQPAADFVMLNFADVVDESTHVMIVNMEGRVLQEFYMEGNHKAQKVDVSNFPSGIYYLQATRNDLLLKQKLVIMR